MAKIVVSLFFALLFNYKIVSSLVTDYSIVSWNSEGFRLQQVFNFFLINPWLDFAFVQNSGNITANVQGYVVSENYVPEFKIVDAANAYSSNPTGLVELRIVQQENIQLYVYYFYADPKFRTTINLAIVTKQLATEILYFPSQQYQQNAQYGISSSNCPVVGIAVGDNVFLNIHAENNRNSIESLLQLNKVRSYMLHNRPRASWLLVGDFNCLPQSIALTVSERLVSPPQNSPLNSVLDYVIYSSTDRDALSQMDNARYQGTVTNALQGSNDIAVYFTYYTTSLESNENSLQAILNQSCTWRQSQYENWYQFYNELLAIKDDVPSTGFMNFMDGSYMQPIVVEGASNIAASAYWQPLDLSVFIGPAVETVHTVRNKRGITMPAAMMYHGLIFIDETQRPILTVFLKDEMLICLKWTEYGWSAPSECQRFVTFSQNEMVRRQQGRTFSRCYNQPSAITIGRDLEKKAKDIIIERNLNILQREFERTVRGNGFYRKENYKSWRDYYAYKTRTEIVRKGKEMSGSSYCILKNLVSGQWNYGYYFNDGSFCIGFYSKHIQETDLDNWLFLDGNDISSWTRRSFSGMFFFDKFGRPAAFSLGGRGLCKIFGCFWLYVYELDNTWSSVKSDSSLSLLSQNTKALRFTINTNNLH